jgi:hypothetical protein
MARCPLELLDDLTGVLTRVRSWNGVTEKSPAVFYLRRQPFLHFHLVDGTRRRADIKTATGWAQVELPRPLPAARRRTLLSALERERAARSLG